ncbi:MAG TPA: cbb3-type cytochrome c oxidase subunit I [Usitatibacter sp.]|nr:cbb3-type cytochrome c oxidase subunit I [Usitatibacter sp.]
MHDLPLHPAAAAPARARAAARAASFDLAMPTDRRRALALSWLVLGLAALAGSGIFSLLLVVSRTPGLNGLIRVADFFRVTLVVHVDLSVLVWFLAFAAMLWSIAGGSRAIGVGIAGIAIAALGAAVMAAAPFLQAAAPVMSNYVPVLDGSVFLTGLALFAAGVLVACARGMAVYRSAGATLSGDGALRLGLNASLVAAGMAAFALAASFAQVDRGLAAATYYELLFWGAGHVLQFAYTLLMLVAWIWLAAAIGARLPLSPRVVALLFGVALASIYVTPYIYLAHPVASLEHAKLQTWLMRFGGAVAVPPIAIAVAWGVARTRHLPPAERALRACLLASLALFSAGGIIGFTISGSNVRIPAHYHGCIVGVTLAMMGATYLLLPRFGYRAPASRLAAWQPWIYGGGQLLHIVGLVISGGYGVQRKVAGAEQVLRSTPEVVGMGIMGLGGLIAIVGGLLFLVIVARSVWMRR